MTSRDDEQRLEADTVRDRRRLALAGAAELIGAAIPDTARLCALLRLSGHQRLAVAIERARPISAMVDIASRGGKPDAALWVEQADRVVRR